MIKFELHNYHTSFFAGLGKLVHLSSGQNCSLEQRHLCTTMYVFIHLNGIVPATRQREGVPPNYNWSKKESA